MSNSFYYFFSATPQVLGGVLALFGVFVIYRLQILEKQLFGLAKEMLEDCHFYKLHEDDDDHSNIKSHISVGLSKKNLRDLMETIRNVKGDQTGNREEFKRLFQLSETIKNSTIQWSIFTSIIILLSLAIIPLGGLLTNRYILTGCIIVIILISAGIVFYRLVNILSKCFS